VKYVRFFYQGREASGLLEGDEVAVLVSDLFKERRPRGARLPLAELTLLPPVRPSKIIAVALNYMDHLPTGGGFISSARGGPASGGGGPDREAPAAPELFLKTPSAVVGPEEEIVIPAGAGRVDAEGELVAVIGRRARGLSPEEALGCVLGYTCGNDVSAREWQRGDIQWWRAKSSDTFAPIGPYIVDDLDPSNLELQTRVNGKVKQRGNTRFLIHDVAHIISFASRVMTLEPGDLIFTGTPGDTPTLSPGDVVEVEIEGIGVLRNPVREEE
jgi:2-keto-4-pentenoate hydratase/2-oxohepta-3-ene-1,7-dioic acid hydratase in catechol pathway